MKQALTQIDFICSPELMEQQFYVELGSAIRTYRRAKNFSQNYMGKKLKISQNAYSKIEAGKSRFSAYRLMHILNLLEMNPRIIMTSNYGISSNFEKYS